MFKNHANFKSFWKEINAGIYDWKIFISNVYIKHNWFWLKLWFIIIREKNIFSGHKKEQRHRCLLFEQENYEVAPSQVMEQLKAHITNIQCSNFYKRRNKKKNKTYGEGN